MLSSRHWTAAPIGGASGRDDTAPGRTVTLADDQHTLVVATGMRLLVTLDLGPGYTWSVAVDAPTILRPLTPAPAGAVALYQASQPGDATLAARGDPLCRAALPPCSAPSRLVTIHIHVR